MSRPLRKRYHGAKYHVTCRGNARQTIFYSAADYERFLEQLDNAVERDGIILFAYCLMPNHFHLFLETPHGNIDHFVGRLCTAYAMYFRYKHDRPGHCFQGRYKATLVAGDDYCVRLIRYIHLNPVKVETVKGWGGRRKWEFLRTYCWSSLPGYLNPQSARNFVDYRWLMWFHKAGGRRAMAAYAGYIKALIEENDPLLTESFHRSSYAFGDESFVNEVERWHCDESSRQKVPSDYTMPVTKPIALDKIADEVTEAFNISRETLLSPHHHHGVARAVFIELACTIGERSQRELARWWGHVSEHAIGKQRQRYKSIFAASSEGCAMMKSIRKKLQPGEMSNIKWLLKNSE